MQLNLIVGKRTIKSRDDVKDGKIDHDIKAEDDNSYSEDTEEYSAESSHDSVETSDFTYKHSINKIPIQHEASNTITDNVGRWTKHRSSINVNVKDSAIDARSQEIEEFRMISGTKTSNEKPIGTDLQDNRSEVWEPASRDTMSLEGEQISI